MAKKIQLSIADPCHENWDKMTPSEQGRFCGACQKQVVDFTNMSDREIAQFFKKPSMGSVCGRFMQDQLDRDLEIPKKRIPWLKYFFQIAIPAFLASTKVYSQGEPKVMGKQKIESPKKKEEPKKSCNIAIAGNVAPRFSEADLMQKPSSIESALAGKSKLEVLDYSKIKFDTLPAVTVTAIGIQRTQISTGYTVAKSAVLPDDSIPVITGKVVDEQGNPVTSASVLIKGTKYGTITNAKGEFTIKPIEKDWEKMTLHFSYVGYEMVEKEVDRKTASNKLNIGLVKMELQLMGFIIRVPDKKAKRLKIKKQLEAQSTVQEDRSPVQLIRDNTETITRHFNIYPNPVRAGSSVTLEWKSGEEGYHNFQLINISGAVVFSKELWIDPEARVLNLELPSVVTGNYIIQVTNKKSGKKFAEKIIIQ